MKAYIAIAAILTGSALSAAPNPQYQIDALVVELPQRVKGGGPDKQRAAKSALWKTSLSTVAYEGEQAVLAFNRPPLERGARKTANSSEWVPFGTDTNGGAGANEFNTALQIKVLAGKDETVTIEAQYLSFLAAGQNGVPDGGRRSSSFSREIPVGKWVLAGILDECVTKRKILFFVSSEKAQSLVLYLMVSPASLPLR